MDSELQSVDSTALFSGNSYRKFDIADGRLVNEHTLLQHRFVDSAKNRTSELNWRSSYYDPLSENGDTLMRLRSLVQRLVNHFGYRIIRDFGQDPASDMWKFIRPKSTPIIFDIGANRGQTVQYFKSKFPKSVIHTFEASPTTFRILQENCLTQENVYCWNCALGAARGKQRFLENTDTFMSSFLELGQNGLGQIEREILLDLETIDAFCTENNVEHIDILKVDTQGYELEVFKGAESLMNENRIGVLYFEVMFSDMYENAPKIDDIFRFLTGNDFVFITYYPMQYRQNRPYWTDALFAHKSLINPTNKELIG